MLGIGPHSSCLLTQSFLFSGNDPPTCLANADVMFLPSFFLSSPDLSGRRLDVYHTSTHAWRGLSAKYRTQKLRKNSLSGLHRTNCRAVSSQLRHVSTIGKKLYHQQYLFHMSSQCGELRHTRGWDRFESMGHPSEFQRVLRVGFVTAATSLTEGQRNFARGLVVSWAGTLYIHFRGLLPPDRISPCAIFPIRPSHVFSYIGSVTAWYSSSRRQPNFAAWYTAWNYTELSETYIWLGGHHVGHRPTF